MAAPTGIISEIIGAIKDVKESLMQRSSKQITTINDASGGMALRPVESIAKKAKRSVLSFPVIVSDAVDPKTAQGLAQAYQFSMAEYVRIMLSNENIVDVTDVKSLEVAKNNIIARLRGGALSEMANDQKSLLLVNSFIQKNMDAIMAEQDEPLHENAFGKPLYPIFGAVVNTRPLQEVFENPADFDGIRLQRQPPNGDFAKSLAASELIDAIRANDIEAIQRGFDGFSVDEIVQSMNSSWGSIQRGTLEHVVGKPLAQITTESIVAAIVEQQNAKKAASEGLKQKRKDRVKNFENNIVNGLAKKLGGKKEAIDEIIAINKLVKVSDSVAARAKENTIQPVLLDLELKMVTNNGTFSSNLVLGIRAVIHRLPAVDMVGTISTSFGKDSLMFNFLRVTSGEISFLSDFLFSFKDIKAQFVNASKTSNLFAKLKRQVTWNKRNANAIYREVMNTTMVPPTSTIILSMDEVQQIRSISGISLAKPSSARDFITTFNLLGLMIVDSSIGAVSIFEDGDDDFNITSLDELSRKGSRDNVVRDMLTVMSRN